MGVSLVGIVTFTPFASNSAMVSCQRTGGIVLSAKRVSHALPSVRPSPRRSQALGAAAEVRHQKATGVRSPAGGDRFGRARGHNLSSVPSTFRSKIDDVVGRLDDIEVVLDDEDGVAAVDEALQAVEEAGDVGQVETGGGLVEDVEDVVAALQLRQFGGQFNALGLAARERRGRLAEGQVAEPEIVENGDLAPNGEHPGEELDAFLDRHVEDVGDGLVAEADFQRFAVVARALTDVALDIDVG